MANGGEGKLDPDRPLVVYDGVCEFCRRWVRRLQRWDVRHGIDYLPLQDPRAPGVTGRTEQELEEAMCVVLPGGAVFAGAQAARELMAYLPLGTIGGVVLRVPGVMRLADRIYRWVASRRHTIGCGGDHCRLS